MRNRIPSAKDRSDFFWVQIIHPRESYYIAGQVRANLRQRPASPPRVVVTDKLGSYPAARRRVARSVEHRRSKYLNNRAENSHQPTRQDRPSLLNYALNDLRDALDRTS
jgi:transposase-like protein